MRWRVKLRITYILINTINLIVMNTTSITISRETKNRLETLIRGKETWDETLRRLIDELEQKREVPPL